MDPFGWRIAAAVVGALMVLVMCRLARRLTGSTVLGCVAGPAAHASTGCTSCCPGWRCSTSSWRSSCSAPCPAWSTTATGTAPGSRAGATGRSPRDGWGPVRPLLFRPWLLRRRRLLRAGARHQVDGGLPAGGVRPAGLALGGGAAALRRALAALRRRSSTAYPPSCTWSWWPASSTSPPGPAGWCTPTSTRRPLASAVHPVRRTKAHVRGRRPTPTTSTKTSGRPRTSPTPAGSARLSSRCGRSGTTTRTSTRSTPTS